MSNLIGVIDIKHKLIELAVSRFNDYLTDSKMAEHEAIDESDLKILLEIGQKYWELQVEQYKASHKKAGK
jgi:hypothetical protein